MFERFTETARRVIFFARYEASNFGSSQIETEHLLLGVLREDKALVSQFLLPRAPQEIRDSITNQATSGEKISTSVDLPVSHECKRAMAYAAEESERINHKQISPAHLLLGLLREEKSFAARLLRERGVTADLVRKSLLQASPGGASIGGLHQWIAEREQEGKWIIEEKRSRRHLPQFLLYPSQDREAGSAVAATPAEEAARAQRRIEAIVRSMERAIANHEFEKSRFYSDEERKERENLRAFCEQHKLQPPPPIAPLVCVTAIGDDSFSEICRQSDGYIAQGVAEVWLLDPASRRAYTFTRAKGLQEFKGETLRVENPPLQLDLEKIFE